MKLPNLIILFLAGFFAITRVAGQANAVINVLTQNTGLVVQGGTVFLQVTINSTGPNSPIGAYRVKAQISVPTPTASIPTTGHVLPDGWIIVNNNGSVITVCNATDVIAVNTARTILIAIQGDTPGAGPVNGQLSFSNGNPAGGCNSPGSLSGDQIGDNFSASTIEVIPVLPVTLTDFNAELLNCQPVLNWTTETEINSARFEIERGNINNADWKSIGFLKAAGNTTLKSKYKFIDKNLNTSEQVLYRLKMFDKDGHYKYSKVLLVSIKCTTPQFYVYPNPVQNGRLYVRLTGASRYSEGTLMTLSGQVILKRKMNNGTNYINLSHIAKGIYVLNIKDVDGFDKKVKVLIQN